MQIFLPLSIEYRGGTLTAGTANICEHMFNRFLSSLKIIILALGEHAVKVVKSTWKFIIRLTYPF